MKDVHVLGVHPDGNQLILSDADGARYSLQITDALRDACKVAPPLRPVAPRSQADEPTPREIQELVRAGATPEDIAREFATTIEKVRRYEGPILAERAHAARKARLLPIGATADSPTLGDLVVDRLAARGVAPHTLSWDAVRAGHGKPWEIIVRFVQNAEEREAHWSLDPQGNHLSAIDEEAAWLTERTTPAGPDRGIATPLPHPAAEASTEATEELLDMLDAQRGIRQEVDMSEFDDEDAAPPTDPAGHRVLSFAQPASARSTDAPDALPAPEPELEPEPADIPASEPEAAPEDDLDRPAFPGEDDAPDTGTLPGMEALGHGEDEPEASTAQQPVMPSRKRHRRPVPSWEEIMFGSQPH